MIAFVWVIGFMLKEMQLRQKDLIEVTASLFEHDKSFARYHSLSHKEVKDRSNYLSAKTKMLVEVVVSDSVVHACYTHAFTTEKEEIMGVLLGEVVTTPHGTKVARVWGARNIQRADKRPDRVEIAPEVLFHATEEADQCTAELGKHTRVIGWYHSHPHITPYPSHVDLRTQATFQQMESGWVGLIFSVFHVDSSNGGTCTMHCFQTREGNVHERVNVVVMPSHAMLKLPSAVCDQTFNLLTTFEEETKDTVKAVCSCTSSSPELERLCRTVADLQMFTFAQLVANPTNNYLSSCVIPFLEGQIESIEKQRANAE